MSYKLILVNFLLKCGIIWYIVLWFSYCFISSSMTQQLNYYWSGIILLFIARIFMHYYHWLLIFNYIIHAFFWKNKNNINLFIFLLNRRNITNKVIFYLMFVYFPKIPEINKKYACVYYI